MYVIVRTDGMFVARPGSKGSYTNALQNAQIFRTYAEADGNRCPGNETVRSVSYILGEY